MEKLDSALADIAGKVAGLAERYGVEAATLALNAAGSVLQASALRYIVLGFAGLGVFVIAALALFFVCKNSDDFDGDGAVGCGFVAFLFACAGLGIAIANLTDPVVWTAASNPHFAIAAKALGKL